MLASHKCPIKCKWHLRGWTGSVHLSVDQSPTRSQPERFDIPLWYQNTACKWQRPQWPLSSHNHVVYQLFPYWTAQIDIRQTHVIHNLHLCLASFYHISVKSFIWHCSWFCIQYVTWNSFFESSGCLKQAHYLVPRVCLQRQVVQLHLLGYKCLTWIFWWNCT